MKARKLHEEKMVMIAHKEGRHRRYKEGLSYGRRLGFDEGRSGQIRYNGSSTRRIPRRAVQPDEEEEDDRSRHGRPDSAPPVLVPTSVTPIPPPSSSHEPPSRRTRTPSSPEEAAYPIPMRLAPSSASGHCVGIPQDGWIPQADPHTSYIPVPPPHDLSQPIPPSRSSHSHELDNHVRQAMFAAEDSSYALVRTRDFAYTQPAALLVPRPRAPSLISKSSSTHMSQYEHLSAPTERRPASSLRHELSSMYTRSESQPERRTSLRGYGHERSHREEFVEQWRIDPEVAATAIPGTAIRDFDTMQPGSHHPESIMPAAFADPYQSSRTEAQPPPVTTQPKSPPRLRNPLDYIRHRFQRTQSNASVPDITVQSPSETASSPSEHAQETRPELLSPESAAHRSLPPTHEEHLRTSGSHLGDTRDTYCSTTPSKPPWPVGFMPIQGTPPSSIEWDSLHSRSRSRGPDEHYQMSPIPEGVMYPDTPLRAQSSHGRRRSKHSEISSSPAPLQRPISLFSDQGE
ncbi:hypothetical protein M405DRAFT_938679 [Rhizopogon salebrosus TDB-379]|nr:hypothetical protein M405DRAFT_938679 [Rhizopogon salebrosus TDB-379]